MYYACLGTVDRFRKYSPGYGFPLYKGYSENDKFFDFYDYWQGYKKLATEFGLKPPYPQRFVDAEGRTWEKRTGDIGEDGNKGFSVAGRQGAVTQRNTGEHFVPQVVQKKIDPNQTWAYVMGNTIGSLKKRGLLKS